MKAKRPSKAQRSSFDIISTLPQTITDTILCLLPIQEAARTSILSRKWRYKWTKIPKLVFVSSTVSEETSTDEEKSTETQTSDIISARKNMDERCKLFYAIHQVLLLRQGPIHEFTLLMSADHHCSEIDQIILHLSRNHPLKKLTLASEPMSWFYVLPSCAFSLHELTDLDLFRIDLFPLPISNGFANLRRLCLNYVRIFTKDLLHLLANCPSLKSFTVHIDEPFTEKDCNVIELFECLPKIEHLTAYMQSVLEMLVLDSVPKELPASLFHLKYVSLKEMRLVDDGLRFLFVLMKCSPKLEKVSLELNSYLCYEKGICSGILEEYSDVSLEHLKELDIVWFSNLKPEMDFLKFILARSPKLKKVCLLFMADTVEEELEMQKVLLRAPRASPVEIDLQWMGQRPPKCLFSDL